jgi:PAS domain S-box-containing protein
MRLLLALDAAHMGTWDWDLGDQITWSPQQEALFGVEHKPHHTFQEFFARLHPDDREGVDKIIAQSRDGGTIFSHEFRVVRPDGSTRWVHARGHFIYDSEQKPVRMLGVTADVTDNRKLEEQLRQSQKLEAIGTLASGIAHDFNNILSAIVGNIELLQHDLSADHAASVSLQEIHKASRRGRDVVRQILAFSRPEIQQRSRLALGPIVTEAAKLLRATLPAGIELRTTIAPNCPDVYADATQIHQVLVNLYTNAWHAIADHAPSGGGRIDVTLHSLHSGSEPLPDTVAPGHYIRIGISDSGIGMSEATMQRIFEPFFTTKSNAHGSGLGLAVVHGIVRSHGGVIVVSSKPNEGSCFDVYFPALPARAEDESTFRDAEAVPHGSGQRILYIDDDEALVFLGVRVLERFGYRVRGYIEPAPALALFTSDPTAFDLVVTDMNMPGMSGLDVVRAVRAVRTNMPVILASGYIDQQLQQQAREYGATRVVYKPNSMDELGKTIHDLVCGLNSKG